MESPKDYKLHREMTEEKAKKDYKETRKAGIILRIQESEYSSQNKKCLGIYSDYCLLYSVFLGFLAS